MGIARHYLELAAENVAYFVPLAIGTLGPPALVEAGMDTSHASVLGGIAIRVGVATFLSPIWLTTSVIGHTMGFDLSDGMRYRREVREFKERHGETVEEYMARTREESADCVAA